MAHSRRRLLALAAAGAASGVAGCGTDDPGDGTPTPSTATDAGTANDPATAVDTRLPAAIGLETLVDGLRAPLDVAFAAGGDRSPSTSVSSPTAAGRPVSAEVAGSFAVPAAVAVNGVGVPAPGSSVPHPAIPLAVPAAASASRRRRL